MLQPIDRFNHCRASETLKSISALVRLMVGQTLLSDKLGVHVPSVCDRVGRTCLGGVPQDTNSDSETATLRQIEQVLQIKPGTLTRFLKQTVLPSGFLLRG